MEFFECIKMRRSIRQYSDRSLFMDDIEKIVDAGRLAATARNEQPWEFIVITNRDRLLELGAIVSPNGALVKGAAAAIVVLCRDTKYYLEDGSAATENMLLAATALGIGSCWIAGDKKDYCQKVLEFCSVPPGLSMKLVSIVALGYPEDASAFDTEKPKRRLDEVLHIDRFGRKKE